VRGPDANVGATVTNDTSAAWSSPLEVIADALHRKAHANMHCQTGKPHQWPAVLCTAGYFGAGYHQDATVVADALWDAGWQITKRPR